MRRLAGGREVDCRLGDAEEDMGEDKTTKLGYRSEAAARGDLSKASLRPKTARARLQTPVGSQEIGAAWGAVKRIKR